MDSQAFGKLVLTHFPSLKEHFSEFEDLLHVQVMEFAQLTQSAIEAGNLDVVLQSFQIANTALVQGDDALQNAIHVTYLEYLDFRGDAGKCAEKLMPSELRDGRNAILDYDEQLLGRRLPNDDR